MMSANDSLLLVSLLLIASVCVVAIFNHEFEDNLAQRVGMSLMAFGSIIQAFAIMAGHTGMWSASIIIHGAAVYAVGTMAKVIRHRNDQQQKN